MLLLLLAGYSAPTHDAETPAERTYTVRAERRTVAVAAERRVVTVPAESRSDRPA